MRAPLLFLAAAFVGSEALSQSVIVPNTAGTLRSTSGLNTITRDLGQARTYMMGIPAAQLSGIPMGSVITGLSFRAWQSSPANWPAAVYNYTDYEVSIGPAAPLAGWTGNFPTNFAGAPVMVRDGAMTIEANTFPTVAAPAPNPFCEFYWDFQKTFTYTGGDLAVMFTHPGATVATARFLDVVPSGPPGPSFSATVFQAQTGGVAATYFVTRVHYGYGAGCPGAASQVPMLVSTNNVAGGGPTSLAIGNAAASAPAVYVFGTTQLSVQLFNGCLLLTNPAVIVGVSTSTTGRNRLNLNIPAGITGSVYIQSFVVDAGAPGSLAGSNATTLTVTP